jgi:predicted Zn-dependent protease
VAACLLMALPLFPATSAQAQSGRKLTIVRDAEIETLLRDYANPIFRAADVNPDSVEIIIVNDRSFNAFVTEGRKMFINAGALMDAETPNEIIGVIAHETGHIEGGHLHNLRQEMDNARMISMVSVLLGAGAAVATSGRNVGGQGIGVSGIIAGGSEMALRTLSAYQRSEELSADRAAMRFLLKTGQAPDGMVNVLRRLGDSGMFSATGRDRSTDPYLMSHPAPRDRIAQLELLVAESPHKGRLDPPRLQERHDLVRAKLFGFLDQPEAVNRRYHRNASSKAGRYARAIGLHRTGRTNDATALIDSLIAQEPDNPYFHELKGQILLEGARVPDSIPPLRKAASLAPGSASIRGRS